MPHDILLEFLNRDSREIYGLFDTPALSDAGHINLLKSYLMIACFLCRNYCACPPGFLVEDPIVNQIARGRRELFDERLIRLPMPESSMGDHLEKKEREYKGQADRYAGLFSPRNREFLLSLDAARMPRRTRMGLSIVLGWEQGPDSNPLFRNIASRADPASIERSLPVPRRLLDAEEAVTFSALEPFLKGDFSPRQLKGLRHVIQNLYFTPQQDEFGLRVLYCVPHVPVNLFMLKTGEPYYNWEIVRSALAAARLWRVITQLSADALLDIRATSAWHEFIDVLWMTSSLNDPHDVSRMFATRRPISSNDRTLEAQFESWGAQAPASGIVLSREKSEAVAERLIDAARLARTRYEELEDTGDAEETSVSKPQQLRLVEPDIPPPPFAAF